MIHKFSVKNFYSFNENVEISFEVNSNAPKTTVYCEDINDIRVSKLLTVIGPNASGKTNLLKVLRFLKFFIIDSFDLKPDEDIPYHPYSFTSKNNESTEFSVTFSCNKVLYEYFVKLHKNQVLDEKFRKYNPETKQFSLVFKRAWNEKKNDYTYSLTNFTSSTKLTAILEKRKNASLISIARQIDHPLSNEIINYWNTLQSNIVEFGKHGHHDNPHSIRKTAKYFAENTEAKKMAEKLLTRFDLGLTKLEIIKQVRKDSLEKEVTDYIPMGFHKGENGEYDLPFLYESHGTKCLFYLLRQIIPVLFSGGIAVLDEFDAELHPHMLPELIALFSSKTVNPKNAQLFFSTHHHEILNSLDKYQIILVGKTPESGASEVWRLDQEGVRTDDNYYSKYITGAYGAIPEM